MKPLDEPRPPGLTLAEAAMFVVAVALVALCITVLLLVAVL